VFVQQQQPHHSDRSRLGCGSHAIPVAGAKELLRINNGNVAVGNIRGGSAGSEGFVYGVRSNTLVNLTDLLPPSQYGRGYSELQDINEANVVTGRGWDGSAIRGLVWSEAAGLTFLPGLQSGLADRVYPRASMVRELSSVSRLHPAYAACLRVDCRGGMRDLNDLTVAPPGFILDWALKINEHGVIIGIGHYGPGWGSSARLRTATGKRRDHGRRLQSRSVGPARRTEPHAWRNAVGVHAS
jgi:hypothetical protein